MYVINKNTNFFKEVCIERKKENELMVRVNLFTLGNWLKLMPRKEANQKGGNFEKNS